MNALERMREFALGVSLTLMAGVLHALPLTFAGYLNDCPGNAALVSSDLSAAVCDNDNAIANNVALYTFSLSLPETVEFISSGYTSGGFFPYFTVFAGTGATASFLLSDYATVFDPNLPAGDFNIGPVLLPAGDFTVAISAFANMSFAENYLGVQDLRLGDGFTGLGDPLGTPLGNYLYDVTVRAAGPSVVPEPAPIALFFVSCIAVSLARRVKRRAQART